MPYRASLKSRPLKSEKSKIISRWWQKYFPLFHANQPSACPSWCRRSSLQKLSPHEKCSRENSLGFYSEKQQTIRTNSVDVNNLVKDLNAIERQSLWPQRQNGKILHSMQTSIPIPVPTSHSIFFAAGTWKGEREGRKLEVERVWWEQLATFCLAPPTPFV